MTSERFWGVLRHRWWWLLIGLAVGIGLALIALLVLPPTYRSEAALLVSADDLTDSAPGLDPTYVEERLPTYVDLGRGDAAHDAIRAELGQDLTREEIEDAVSYTPTPGSMVITVAGAGDTAEEARDTARAATTALGAAIDSTSGGEVVVATEVVTEATLPEDPEEPDPLVVLPAGAVVGLLVPLVLALLRRDPR